MSTPLAAFGPGILIASRTDITIPSPVNVGYAQEFSIENAATNKPLYGQKKYPLVVAQGTIKSTGKFKAATLSGLAWNALMYGETAMTAGGIDWNVDSTFSVPATSAYTVTVTNSSLFDADLGLRYSSDGLPFQRVSTGNEAAGKYSMALGVYTFAAADLSKALKITYTTTRTTGQSLIVTNKTLGITPTFQLDYWTNLNQPTSKPFAVRVYSAVAAKHAIAGKLEDFIMPEFDFDIFANASDQVYDFVFPEIS